MARFGKHSGISKTDSGTDSHTQGFSGLRGMRVPHSERGRVALAVVATVATLLLVAVGVLCVAIPQTIVHVLPYLLGSVMALAGIAGVALALRESPDAAGDEAARAAAESDDDLVEDAPKHHLVKEGPRGIGASFVLSILGLFSIVCGEQSIGFLGTAWGLVSLYKVGGEFDEALGLWRQKKHVAVVSVLFGALELVLALLLILNPFENIDHHVIVLGIELVMYPLKLHRERGKRGAEVQV